ncbi:hypothetical protein RUE5091_04339 [Ruegeria denitrificans]|uniref:Uncharacterized protein n=1 Tax=Ruegeria denitrificans TaxID=1715692 RepID=A0A0P1IK75_9RHOB|nr:hypothetical protein RUE5091_04339 [Ruegeria denitrificans]
MLNSDMARVEEQDSPEFRLSALNTQVREMVNTVLRPHGLKLVEWRLLQCLADQVDLRSCLIGRYRTHGNQPFDRPYGGQRPYRKGTVTK